MNHQQRAAAKSKILLLCVCLAFSTLGIACGKTLISALTTDSTVTANQATTVNETATEGDFVSVWTSIEADGGILRTSVALPLIPNGIYDFDVIWGDGTISHVSSYGDTGAQHSYDNGGSYTIIIRGKIEGICFGTTTSGYSCTDQYTPQQITEIRAWGNLKLGNEGSYFEGCQNLVITAQDKLDLSGTDNFHSFFSNCGKLEYPGIAQWDTSRVTDMSYMFYWADKFDEDISAWDTGNVKDMSFMFCHAKSFNADIGAWDTANVVLMKSMFRNSGFNQDLNAWNVSKVQSMAEMFESSPFNGQISDWDTSSVTDMKYMFASSPFNQDISRWDTSKVVSTAGMFEKCSFNGNIGNWNMSSLLNMSHMFDTNSVFNQDISGWDTSSVTNFYGAFADATSFNQNLGSWNICKAEEMSYMFYYSGINKENYGAILVMWSALPLANKRIVLGAHELVYPASAQEARDKLINDFSWVIIDNGYAE